MREAAAIAQQRDARGRRRYAESSASPPAYLSGRYERSICDDYKRYVLGSGHPQKHRIRA
jgi:hypothetical protein